MSANLENSAVATGLEKVSFHSNPKKGNAKERSNYSTIALISHASKFSSVRSLSCVWLFATPWTAVCQAFLSITNSWSLLKLMLIESVMPSNHVILCCPLLLLPSIFPTKRVFSNESVLCISIGSFSFSISPSNDCSELISFRIDWFDLLAVQGTLKSLLYFYCIECQIETLYVIILAWDVGCVGGKASAHSRFRDSPCTRG